MEILVILFLLFIIGVTIIAPIIIVKNMVEKDKKLSEKTYKNDKKE